MKISIFTKNGALGSDVVFKSFAEGAKKLKFKVTENDMNADAAVIWSVLWQGRMKDNKTVFHHYKNQKKPVFILETGHFFRSRTWKFSLNGTSYDNFPHFNSSDISRLNRLGIKFKEWQKNGEKIIICPQNPNSLQWSKQGTPEDWVNEVIKDIRKVSDRSIVIRPHPRVNFNSLKITEKTGIFYEKAEKIPGTIDSVDFENSIKNAHAVVNYNSGPSVVSALHGIPVFCDISSPARPISHQNLEKIEDRQWVDRKEWLSWISHTEWLKEEIAEGLPLSHFIKHGLILDN